jgi:hypothetical protein
MPDATTLVLRGLETGEPAGRTGVAVYGRRLPKYLYNVDAARRRHAETLGVVVLRTCEAYLSNTEKVPQLQQRRRPHLRCCSDGEDGAQQV